MAALRSALGDLRRFLFGTWLRAIFGAWFCLLMLAFAKNAVVAAKVTDHVTGLGIITCGLSTFLFWTCRSRLRRALGRWRLRPALRFVIIGGLGAAWAELIFWGYQTAFHITGVAANANLGLDLLVTMPWYLLMLALLWRAVTRHAYSYRELAFLGGAYDLCADGLLRQALGGALSVNAALLDVIALPMFIAAYSVMVLPPCALLAEETAAIRAERPPQRGRRLLYGLLPITGLLPYTAALLIVGGILWR
jgi:hypothetical protein